MSWIRYKPFNNWVNYKCVGQKGNETFQLDCFFTILIDTPAIVIKTERECDKILIYDNTNELVFEYRYYVPAYTCIVIAENINI